MHGNGLVHLAIDQMVVFFGCTTLFRIGLSKLLVLGLGVNLALGLLMALQYCLLSNKENTCNGGIPCEITGFYAR